MPHITSFWSSSFLHLCLHCRTLKDTKRRVLQASVAAVDPSLKTVDHEYDIHVAKFPEVKFNGGNVCLYL